MQKKNLARADKTLRGELINDFDESLRLVEKLPFEFNTFILASNTKKFGEIQDHAAALANQNSFDVRFLSWKDIEKHISTHPEIRKKYFPHLVQSDSSNPTKLDRQIARSIRDGVIEIAYPINMYLAENFPKESYIELKKFFFSAPPNAKDSDYPDQTLVDPLLDALCNFFIFKSVSGSGFPTDVLWIEWLFHGIGQCVLVCQKSLDRYADRGRAELIMILAQLEKKCKDLLPILEKLAPQGLKMLCENGSSYLRVLLLNLLKANRIWTGFMAQEDILNFEDLRSSSLPKGSLPNPQKMLKKRNSLILENDYIHAAQLAEEAAKYSKNYKNQKLELQAHGAAARDFSNFIFLSNLEKEEREEVLSKISYHIKHIESNSEKQTESFLLWAQFYSLKRELDKALEYAMKVIHSPHSSDSFRGEAYICYLETLWRMQQSQEAIPMTKEIEEHIKSQNHAEIKIALSSDWIRTLCKAKALKTIQVENYLETVKEQLKAKKILPKRLSLALDDVFNELRHYYLIHEARLVCTYHYELAKSIPDFYMASIKAAQIAEIEAELGNHEKALLFLGDSDRISEKIKFSEGGDLDISWINLRAILLLNKGKTFFRLAKKKNISAIDSLRLLDDSIKIFNDALSFSDIYSNDLRGNSSFYNAEIAIWRGKVYFYLGKLNEALNSFRMAQAVSTMSLPSFGATLGMKARLMEGYTLLLLGQLTESAQKIDSLIGGTGVPAELESKAKGLKGLLKERVSPFLEWSGTVEAKNNSNVSVEGTPRNDSTTMCSSYILVERNARRRKSASNGCLGTWRFC